MSRSLWHKPFGPAKSLISFMIPEQLTVHERLVRKQKLLPLMGNDQNGTARAPSAADLASPLEAHAGRYRPALEHRHVDIGILLEYQLYADNGDADERDA